MCIRDRVGIDHGQGLQSALLELKLGAADFAAKERLQHGYACLLYTSDAADERSSVDLGGRRIIKKKKKIERDEQVYQTEKTQRMRPIELTTQIWKVGKLDTR